MTVIARSKASLNGSSNGVRNGHGRGAASPYAGKRFPPAFRYLLLFLAFYSVSVTVVLLNRAASGSSTGGNNSINGLGHARDDEEKSRLKSTILSLKQKMRDLQKTQAQVDAAPKGDPVDYKEKMELKKKVATLEHRIEEMKKNAVGGSSALPPPKKARYLRDETPSTRGGGVASTKPKPTKVWTKTEHTMSVFKVAGVNLAQYEMESGGAGEGLEKALRRQDAADAPKFELFDDFNIADRITGNESWEDLMSYRRGLRRLSLSFYVDKVALKRWLLTVEDMPIPQPYHLAYKSEIPTNDAMEEVWQMIKEMVPPEMSFAAKTGHLDHAKGVYLAKYEPGDDSDDDDDGTYFVSTDAENLEEADTLKIPSKTAKYLAEHLIDKADRDSSSWALEQAEPGFVIEERLALWDHDDRPAMHFQVIVIWGRAYLALWGRGLSLWGLVRRNGDVVDWAGMHKRHAELPEWVDWERVVELAERMGAHKDMLRVDVFVGVPADSPVLADDGAADKDRRAALRTVISDCELTAKLDLEGAPGIAEEAARLWISGYRMGNYDIVQNDEIPAEYAQTGLLAQPPETKHWIKTPYTFTKFDIFGVNLATYRMDGLQDDDKENEEPFELYANFDISDLITGNENWWKLVEYRRELARRGLNFYVDKVAQKRWLPSIGMPIPRPFLTRYASEVIPYDIKAGTPFEWETVKTMLPQESNYAAKPSHTSCSDGVWLVKYNTEDGEIFVGAGSQVLKKASEGKIEKIAQSLAKNLREEPRELESWALKNVRPGLVAEERFTAFDSDDKSAMEFKIFCFWGRVWLANWRRGSDRWGLVHRDGKVVDWAGMREGHEVIPKWVHWPRVIEIAETMAAHKDMFRVDIFVGVPASSPSLKGDVTDEEKKAAVEIVISEFEVHPTTKFKDPRLFEEAARLWIAGYKKLKIKAVPNSEVPLSYVETGMLPQPPDSREWVKTKHTTDHFEIAGVDLASYGFDGKRQKDKEAVEEAPFELYDTFDIGDKLTGNEMWWDLIAIRLDLEDRPALPFYNDKVALRRWLPSVGVPMAKSFALKYGSELTESGEKGEERRAIMNLLPTDEDFVAKPSHACFGDDVWIVKHTVNKKTKKKEIRVNGGLAINHLTTVADYDPSPIGEKLSEALHHEPGTYGSWLYDHIKPGVVIEERFASLDDADRAAVEFKVFTIWGKCHIAQWRRGAYSGLVYSDGRVVEWTGTRKKFSELPDWVDWPQVVKLAERMGAHKDMFRTDIFVGVPSGSKAMRKGATEEERRAAVQVVLNEFELQPGTKEMDPGIFDDAARLWIAGYKIGNYKVVKNTEVPAKYLENFSLAESDVLPNKKDK